MATNAVAGKHRGALIIVALLSLAISTVSAYYRGGWVDEGQYSNSAHNLATNGGFGTTVLASGPGLLRVDQRTYNLLPLLSLAEAAWYKLAPATLFSTRV